VNDAKFHHKPINDGTLGYFEERRPNKNNNNNKKSIQGRVNRREGSGGQMTPGNLPGGQTWYFDPPRFFGRNIFWYTGHLILSKIIKIVAITSCQILMHKIGLLLGLCLQTPLGSLQRSPRTLAGFKGPPRNVALMLLTDIIIIVMTHSLHRKASRRCDRPPERSILRQLQGLGRCDTRVSRQIW